MEFLFLGILTCVIGALPFGLVNLSVLKHSLSKDKKSSMRIAHGASLVEIVYAGLALWLGEFLYVLFEASPIIRIIIVVVLIATSAFFFFSHKQKEASLFSIKSLFVQGVLLNLLSVQVLLYWVLAVSYLLSNDFIFFNKLEIISFILGVWFGKMGTLKAYAFFSKRIISRTQFISANINKIMAVVLFIAAVIQVYKI